MIQKVSKEYDSPREGYSWTAAVAPVFMIFQPDKASAPWCGSKPDVLADIQTTSSTVLFEDSMEM